MRQDFNPGHSLETPILPERKKFSLKGGNIEYQITNFALSLAYALTAHKCQGETLDTIIIDFGAEKAIGMKNFICLGSFYVILTRVRKGKSVFLEVLMNHKLKKNSTQRGSSININLSK